MVDENAAWNFFVNVASDVPSKVRWIWVHFVRLAVFFDNGVSDKPGLVVRNKDVKVVDDRFFVRHVDLILFARIGMLLDPDFGLVLLEGGTSEILVNRRFVDAFGGYASVLIATSATVIVDEKLGGIFCDAFVCK